MTVCRITASRLASVMRKVGVILALVFFVASAGAHSNKAPNFTSDAVWIDTGQGGVKVTHSIKGYRGHVVIVDFWEYTCINCIRDFAVLKRWYAKYHPYGFDIIGVHYGEFPMGFKVENVRQAATRFRLPWPVVADIHGSIWNAYHSDVWPNRYLIDQSGEIVMHVKGEGHNRPLEDKLRELLASAHPEISAIPLDPPENTFIPECGISTQETYVGDWFGRGALENSQGYHDGSVTDFRATHEPEDGRVMLGGEWRTEQEGVTSAKAHGKVELRYHARSLYAVMSAENPKKPIRVDVLQDGKPLTKDEAAGDVQFDSQSSYIEINEPRMYYVLKNPTFGSHLLTLEPQSSGFTLNSFTYGNNCQQDF